jgi:hypothetical protein
MLACSFLFVEPGGKGEARKQAWAQVQRELEKAKIV